jgi:hypothetical protein
VEVLGLAAKSQRPTTFFGRRRRTAAIAGRIAIASSSGTEACRDGG